MTQTSAKKERRAEYEHEKIANVKRELQTALLSFHSWKHELFEEYEKKGGAGFIASDPRVYEPGTGRRVRTQTGTGKRIHPFISGEVCEPLEPVKVPKGVKLVLKDESHEFKEPITSPAMQKNLRKLELRLNTKNYLYSSKAFDPTWNWQTQAIWLRLTGLGYKQISKRLKKSLNTVKSMFKRLGISKFFPRVSRYDWATIGFGRKNTPSGWNMILYGGCSGMLYPSSESLIDEKSGMSTPRYLANFNVGEKIGKEYPLKTEVFDQGEHKKGIIKRAIEETKRKERITLEQKTIEIENLQRSIEEGFDLETGKYPKKKKVV